MLTGTMMPPEASGGSDDRDLLTVYVGSVPAYLGIQTRLIEPTNTHMNDLHGVSYEVKDFIHRLLRGEPRPLMFLFSLPTLRFSVSKEGALIEAKKEMFLSKRVYGAFLKEAKDCFIKMQTYPHHMTFKAAKRKEIFDRVGYDGNMAAKGLLLLNLGAEILATGECLTHRVLQRKDSELYRRIKRGDWGLPQFLSQAEHMTRVLHKAHQESKLKEEPGLFGAEDLLLKILTHYLAAEIVGMRRDLINEGRVEAWPPLPMPSPSEEGKKEDIVDATEVKVEVIGPYPEGHPQEQADGEAYCG